MWSRNMYVLRWYKKWKSSPSNRNRTGGHLISEGYTQEYTFTIYSQTLYQLSYARNHTLRMCPSIQCMSKPYTRFRYIYPYPDVLNTLEWTLFSKQTSINPNHGIFWMTILGHMHKAPWKSLQKESCLIVHPPSRCGHRREAAQMRQF